MSRVICNIVFVLYHKIMNHNKLSFGITTRVNGMGWNTYTLTKANKTTKRNGN